MKVYIVTWGEYSDYGIVKVFADKQQAERYIRARHRNDGSFYFGGEDYHIEEYEVEKETHSMEPERWQEISVFICADSAAHNRVRLVRPVVYVVEEAYADQIKETCFPETWRTGWEVTFTLKEKEHGYSADKLLKIAQDKLAKWRYEKECQEG